MYSSNNNLESELMSSYAWDTALNFLCQTNTKSGEGYNLSITTSNSHGNIGTYNKKNTGAYAADNYSNIHDILGNCREWTTEYYSSSAEPCVARGGRYGSNNLYAAFRSPNPSSDYAADISFRLQLYLK